ncbi:MAG: PLP-dependent aspartate aminotransferase family protein [Acidimicrobiia bacterium]
MTDGVAPETRLTQGPGHDPATGAIVPPLHPSTTFMRDASHELIGDHIYSRYGSPNVDAVEALAADLDGGADAAVFASGLAGVAALFETVDSGRHIAAPRVMYHGAQDWLRRISERRDIELTLFDDIAADGIREALRPGITDLVWIECPVNPTWEVADIAAVAAAVHEAGASLAVDATGAPPVTMQALELGADYVFHSATKYFNGHTDLLAGILVTGALDARWEDVRLVRKLSGGVLGAFEAWLLMRGMRTLHLRYERASSNALAIARHLEGNPAIESVLYPGLESHPHHEIACRQMTNGFGGMMSLLVAGGEDAARAVVGRVRLLQVATSLGGVESLIEHRYVVEGSHSVVPRNLLRISVGIENLADLIDDLDQALAG